MKVLRDRFGWLVAVAAASDREAVEKLIRSAGGTP